MIDKEEIKNNIFFSKNFEEYKQALMVLNDLVEESIFMLTNPNWFTYNDKYYLLDNLLDVCSIFSSDRRATGTIMKHIGLNE